MAGNRTAGVGGGSVPGNAVTITKDAPEKEDEDLESTLLSDLVEIQGAMGNGEFFPKVTHEEAVADYGLSALNGKTSPSEVGG